MSEWVKSTVAEILDLAPREVYDIGCGTGLLVTRIAPVLRLRTDLAVLEALRTTKKETELGELKRVLQAVDPQGIHPADLLNLAEETESRVLLSSRVSKSDGSYDAIFVPGGSLLTASCPTFGLIASVVLSVLWELLWPRSSNSQCWRFAIGCFQSNIQ